MAWREAANTLAFIVGPAFGGMLFAAVGLHGVIAAAGVASLSAGVTVALLLEEPRRAAAANKARAEHEDAARGGAGGVEDFDLTPTSDAKQPSGASDRAADADYAALSSRGGIRAMARVAVSCPLGRYLWQAVGTICVVSALYHVGQVSWDAFFGILARARFGIDAGQLGNMMTISACLSFAVSTVGFPNVEKRVGIATTSVLGLTLVGMGLVAVGSAATPAAMVAAMACYAVGVPLFSPTVPILLLKVRAHAREHACARWRASARSHAKSPLTASLRACLACRLARALLCRARTVRPAQPPRRRDGIRQRAQHGRARGGAAGRWRGVRARRRVGRVRVRWRRGVVRGGAHRRACHHGGARQAGLAHRGAQQLGPGPRDSGVGARRCLNRPVFLRRPTLLQLPPPRPARPGPGVPPRRSLARSLARSRARAPARGGAAVTHCAAIPCWYQLF